jgi:hypothetical protein
VSARRGLGALGLGLALATGCGGTLDAGRDVPHGKLPVDERNPVILCNDAASDNWIGEYAVLLANTGGPPLAGIVVGTSKYWPDLKGNASGWTNLVAAAQSSGLKNVPRVTQSAGAALARPADGQIDSTAANHTAGAQLIVDLSLELGTSTRPVVIAAGGPLTDVANAYFIDRSVVERVVVLAAIGTYASPNGAMGQPNGDLDPWADWIVAERFRYIQVSAFYDQTGDVTSANLGDLPSNPLGTWMTGKQPNLFTVLTASDQVTVLSLGLPTFVTSVERFVPDVSAAFDPSQGPPLVPSSSGNVWIVTGIAARLAPSRLWMMLLDPRTFGA